MNCVGHRAAERDVTHKKGDKSGMGIHSLEYARTRVVLFEQVAEAPDTQAVGHASVAVEIGEPAVPRASKSASSMTPSLKTNRWLPQKVDPVTATSSRDGPSVAVGVVCGAMSETSSAYGTTRSILERKPALSMRPRFNPTSRSSYLRFLLQLSRNVDVSAVSF